MSITETVTVTSASMEERLAPKLVTFPPPIRGRTLLRSRSFDMLRQFPAYLCSRGTSQDIFEWIYNSRTKLSNYFTLLQKEAHKVLIVLSIWTCLVLIGLQMIWCLTVITQSSATLPFGFVFLLTCILIITSMAATMAFTPPKRPPVWRRLKQ